MPCPSESWLTLLHRLEFWETQMQNWSQNTVQPMIMNMVFIDSFVAGLMAKDPQPGTNDTHGWIWECHHMEWWTACIVQMELTFLQCGKFYHWHWHPISELYYLRNQMPATSLLHCTISIQVISWNLIVEKDEWITESKENTIALLVTLLF